MPSADQASESIEPLRVTVVSVVTTAHTQVIVSELRREMFHVDLAVLTVLAEPPRAPVVVVSLDAAIRAEIAPRFVSWAATGELRAGLIGLVEDGTTIDQEELLAAGFDDVVSTPVSTRELIARVRAVHRRVYWKGVSNGRVRYAGITLDLHGRELWIDGTTITMTSIELAVLRELMKARGKPLSRTDLLDLAWGEAELEVSERAVDNVILRIRRKLPNPEVIETVRGVGFRIAAPAT